MRARRVRALLMGGQACVFYGAAEFSRDTDLATVADAANLARLRRALADLQADVIAVPPFTAGFLRRGHAVHFRCRHPSAAGMRVDVMAKMRGVAPFETLWRRRTSLELIDGARIDLLGLPDLVQAKKTQRDKDWPVIRRLVEAHYFEHRANPAPAHIRFWLQELRTPEILVALAADHTRLCQGLASKRPLLTIAVSGRDLPALELALLTEEAAERASDRQYWLPLRAELERLRRRRPASGAE
jgi:hypothetical protein